MVVKHAFWWYFMLFWDKFQIIASVLVIWNISPAGTRVAPSESRSTHQLLLTFGSDRLLLITSSLPCIWILKTWVLDLQFMQKIAHGYQPSSHPIASIWNNTHTLMLLLLLLMLIWIFGCQVLPTSDADLVQVQWHWQWRWCLLDDFPIISVGFWCWFW